MGLAIAISLVGCGDTVEIPKRAAQNWQGIQIEVETRPVIPTSGMNEFLIIATRTVQLRQPAHDLIISLRMNDSDPWKQAIQDGYVGVYRRAMVIQDPVRQSVQVRVEARESQTILHFPIALPPTAAHTALSDYKGG